MIFQTVSVPAPRVPPLPPPAQAPPPPKMMKVQFGSVFSIEEAEVVDETPEEDEARDNGGEYGFYLSQKSRTVILLF